MALIVITIADEDDGRVDVKLIPELALPVGHPEDATPAHGVALSILGAFASSDGAAVTVS